MTLQLQATAVAVVDLTNAPSPEDEVEVVRSVPGNRPLSAMQLIDNGRRRLSAALQAVPGLAVGKGPKLQKQSPMANKEPSKPAPTCGICIEGLSEPACGPCGYDPAQGY